MRRTSRLVLLCVTLLLVQFILGAVGGVREASAAVPTTGRPHHVHVMASHHRAAPDTDGRSPAWGSVRTDAPASGPHGCAGLARGDCDGSGMPSGAPCCATHCTASPALGGAVSLSVERAPVTAPEWGISFEPFSINPAPDRPPPRV